MTVSYMHVFTKRFLEQVTWTYVTVMAGQTLCTYLTVLPRTDIFMLQMK